MNIRCPHCQTVFRVNPERIPAGGVRAKCARCGDTFTVKRPPAAPGGAPAASTPPTRAPSAQSGAAAPTAAPSAAPPPSRAGRGSSAAAAEPPTPPPPHSSVGSAPAAGTAAATGAPSGKASPFGARDPRARAERLARALVSDIVAYHPERRDESLASGNLRAEFREEIMKSWEEYVAQVGLDVAKSTPYFREALNSILAKGQAVF